MNPDQAILQTKIRIPRGRAETVTRPDLEARVRAGLRGPLTLVIAPAGFGKSTLLADSIRATGIPAAWLSLDGGDNQPRRFLGYLIAALRAADGTLGGEAAQMLSAGQETPVEAVLTSLINDLENRQAQVVLALDDYQSIHSAEVHAALAFLVEHLPGGLRLAIASRADPPIPAARLRARGLVTELRAVDLRFSAQEAAQFLNGVMGLSLESADVTALEERTEGWIAGLQLAALSLRGRADASKFVEKFTGTHRFILDYLLEEVLAGQPPEVQQFLLQTSPLERFCAPLCAAVLGWDTHACAQMIEAAERTNLFVIALDDERRWYRYHHLFADLLRARLEQLAPGAAKEPHRRAALWLEEAGMAVEAINHALAAGAHQQAARLVEQNTTALIARGELGALMGWIGALPEDILLTRPWLCLHQSYALAFAGRLAEVTPLLAQVDRALAGVVDDSERASLAGAAQAVRSMVAVMAGRDAEAIENGRSALELLPAGRWWDRAAAEWGLGFALRSLGRLDEALVAFEEQARLAREMGNIWTLVTALMDQGNVLRAQGHLRRARACFETALAEAARQGARSLGYIARMEAGLASVLYEHNELDAAQALLEEAIAHSRLWPNPNHLAFAFTLQARVLLAPGRSAQAERMLAEADAVRSSATLARMVRRMVETEWVRVYLARPTPQLAQKTRDLAQGWQAELESSGEDLDEPAGMAALALAGLALAGLALPADQPGQARALLARMTRSARRGGQINVLISALALSAVAEHVAGREREALAALGEALALAQPGGYTRVFLDLGPSMQALLERWLASAPPGLLAGYASHLLAQSGPSAPPEKPTSGLIEPLSRRELEVLRLIALGKTNQQIAATLVVALGTVKAHCAAIFGKLEVANRTEAVARARQLGLLDDDLPR